MPLIVRLPAEILMVPLLSQTPAEVLLAPLTLPARVKLPPVWVMVLERSCSRAAAPVVVLPLMVKLPAL